MNVKPAIETLIKDGFTLLKDRRVGLMSNPSAVDTRLRSTFLTFRDAPQVNLTALFSPEHGHLAAVPDAESVPGTVDTASQLKIHSLYEDDAYHPTAEMLDDIDVIVCDIQDVGVRFYTYIWTISYILEAAGEHGVEVILLDRPNPLGGVTIEGPTLVQEYASFVGRSPIPLQHGLTVGELAQMFNAVWNPTPAELTVVPCEGWKRALTWDETGLLWVPTSPGVPHLNTVWQYPGACLVEGVNLSLGRGTGQPFEVIGAPWVNSEKLADHLNDAKYPGVIFRPHSFRPSSDDWAEWYCHGVQVHITDRAVWKPIHVWLQVIGAIRHLYRDRFEWTTYPRPGNPHHFDNLTGSSAIREAIDAAGSVREVREVVDDLASEWLLDTEAFKTRRRPYLLYE